MGKVASRDRIVREAPRHLIVLGLPPVNDRSSREVDGWPRCKADIERSRLRSAHPRHQPTVCGLSTEQRVGRW